MMMIAPPARKGLLELNRELFNITIQVNALRIDPALAREALLCLRDGWLLHLPKIKSIIQDPDSDKKLVLLDLKVKSLDQLPNQINKWSIQGFKEYNLKLGYEYWTTEEILRSILPPELDVPSSFETIGHIAHLNLRPEYDEYKKIIGQVIIDKSKLIKTVVNKIGQIHHTFRYFDMEVLAGEKQFETTVNESGCILKLDYSKVYWNSRLQGEHDRLVGQFNKGDIVCDVFAGIGPFALPAAKNKDCWVFANDLNPQSYKYLCENISLNKLYGKIKPYNLDARDFIKQAVIDIKNQQLVNEMNDGALRGVSKHRNKKQKPEIQKLECRNFDHFVMNLPASAPEFLDAFKGIFSEQDKLPLIHVYCFSKSENPQKDAVENIEQILGTSIGEDLINVYDIRDVAPKKRMLCVSFRLPTQVAYSC